MYVLTNAAGGTLPGMQTGCLMSITDHATSARFNSLFGFETIGCQHVEMDEKNYHEALK